MANSAEHLQRAEQNRILAERLLSDGERNWSITVTFYAALHHLAAVLSDLGIDTETLTHVEMQARLDRHFPAEHRTIARYLALSGMSRRTRYFPAHEADAEACRRARQHLEAVADFARRVRSGEIVPTL